MCIFSFRKYVPFFCELMEIKGITFMKKHWISTIEIWDEKIKFEPMDFFLGVFPNYKPMGFYFGGLQNGEIR